MIVVNISSVITLEVEVWAMHSVLPESTEHFISFQTMLFQQEYILTVKRAENNWKTEEVTLTKSGTMLRERAIEALEYYQANWPQNIYYIVGV